MSGPEDGRDGRSGDEDMPEEIDTDINDIIELDQEELHAGDDDDGQFDVEGSPSKSQENNRDREQQERKDDDKSDKPREKSKDRNRDRDRDRNRDRDGRRDRRDSGRRDQGGRRDQRGGRFHPYGGRDRDGGRDRTMGRVVFVSNIPFEMKWQELKDLMRKEVGEVTYTELFYDPDGKSKGVGVVEFASRDSLNRCIDKMNKFQIRGRGLVVKVDTDRRYSDKYRRQADKEQKARVMLTPQVLAQLNLDPSTVTDTVFVSNIPFDVEWMELKDVFQIAGKVIHCDILTDNRGKSKGSATVKFESILEAVNAISMLHNQMLYSRKLSVKMDQAKRDRDRPPKQLPLPSGLSRLGPSLESLASGMGSGLGGGSRGGLGGGMGGGLGGGLGGGGGMGNMGMGNMGNMGGMDSGLGNLGNFGGLGGGLDGNRMSNLGGNTGLGGGFGGNLSSGLGGNLSSGLGSSLGSSLGGMGGFGGGDLSQSSLGMGGLGSLGMGSDLSLMGNMGGGGLGLLGSGMGMGMGKDTFGDSMGTMRDDRDRDRGRDRGDRDRRGGGGGRDRDRDRDNFRGRGGDSGSQVFVRNLPFKYTWQDLKDRFKMIGPVQFAEVKTHPETGRSKGFGTVRFQNPNDAMKAIREMNGSRLDGREIEVSLDYA
ncbi:myelin expression factor 2-like [Acanthaster planci]|uniref:Myelin expression factor 2-like n=1 Tax=Acanthaster planci TaxID=133434 RepID=A0A8B7Z208_ACAPL|nr:myelin expression factor 2-like [Acanthaster planci]